jgi:hypothetical protein
MKFQDLNKMLIGRNSNRKKLANNTYAIRRADSIAIRLHNTDIATFFQDGKIVLNSGGWKTPTTKDRLNNFTPFSISQNKGVWTIHKSVKWKENRKHFPKSHIFQDGMIFQKGKFFGAGNEIEQQTLRKQVRDYAKLVVSKLPLEKPNSGDCWYCAMQTEKGESLGEATKNVEHLHSHLKEGYVVPSLVFNAMKAAGCNPQGGGSAWFHVAFGNSNIGSKNQIGSFVRRYLYKQFGLAT